MQSENKMFVGDHILEVDVVQNQTYYSAKKDRDHCTCAGCRNYLQFAKNADETIREFFRPFGLSVTDVAESAAVYSDDPNFVYYDAWYHLCGKILFVSEKEFWLGDWAIYFKEEKDLPPDDLPEPSFQMQVHAKIPWVLSERNPYIE